MSGTQIESYDDAPLEPRRSRAPWVLLALVLVAGAGLAGWLAYRLQLARLEDASALRDARADLARAQAQRDEVAQQLARVESEKKDLAVVKDELSHDVQAKDEELAKLRGEFDQLQDKMKAEIEKGNVRLSQEKGRIKVDMVDEILFDVGDSTVSRRGEEVLSRVGAVLAGMKDKQIQVSGHTDDLPISTRLKDRFPTNWELSAARAITVVRFLEERAGIPGGRLVAAAHSQFEPISRNDSTRGRARNRRIEILLTPQIDPDRADKPAPVPAPGVAKAPPAPARKVPAAAPARGAKKQPAAHGAKKAARP
ncbi:MAG TPA: OmpA family protein [Anaeromyxobacter sp.]|nr:OmpA family protein [Anaeromyxobacter sp.]